MNLLTNKYDRNVFVSLLEILKVRYTKWFSFKYYNEHPYKNNMYGLSMMLSEYNIENQGGRIKDKQEALFNLDVPFIAHVNNDFVTVYDLGGNNVKYVWKDKYISVSYEEFVNTWSGNILLVESNEDSVEPDYVTHHKLVVLSFVKRIALVFAFVFVLGMVGYYTGLYVQLKFVIALFINLIGGYISCLLFFKQIHIYSSHADKICSLLVVQSDCNNILNSKGAKIASFSWSEIGLGYFIGNVIIILFFPYLYPCVTVINVFALPYTLWSIIYQKIIVRQWCPLCLIVQCVLWMFFLFNAFFVMMGFDELHIVDVLLTGSIYVIFIILLNMIGGLFLELEDKYAVSQELNSLKLNKDIFNMIIRKKNKYEVDKSYSNLVFGDIESDSLITVITNPHCGPCAKMHEKINKILRGNNNNFCVQYILTSFGKDFDESNKLIIAMYQKLGKSDFVDFLDEWYDYGRFEQNKIINKYPFEYNISVEDEFMKHKRWIDKTKIRATPVILFNGYEIPHEIYEMEICL